jgi:hypothetical protein
MKRHSLVTFEQQMFVVDKVFDKALTLLKKLVGFLFF